MRVLCVAEKNSVSKGVTGVLSRGGFETRDSKYKYVKNYTFRCTLPQWGECDITMTAVAGHISEKDVPSEYGWNNSRPEDLFSCPLVDKLSADGKKIADNIKDLASKADKLMIWTDCDREGEYIGWEIVQQANKGNSAFDVDTAYRAKFSHLESSHVYRAACNPERLDKKAIEAVQTRIELDLRIGYAFTRSLTDSFKPILKRNISNGGGSNNKKKDNTMVSYGNCQFPTLGFVVDRFKRIKYFKSEAFWYLALTLKKGFTFSWERGRLFDRLLMTCIYQNCILAKKNTAVVKEVETKPTKNYAPFPLTTVELQKDCSRYFKLSAKEALAAAESLYTKGLVSYPRTETDSFPRGMDFAKYIKIQEPSNLWGSYAAGLLNTGPECKFRIPRAGSHDDEAHPPIHPVGYSDMSGMNAKEKQVYEYIVRRFLACCSLDATGSLSTLKLQWHTETFSANGLVVHQRNYLEIYKYWKWESSGKTLPDLSVGEEVKFTSVLLNSGKTSPPSPLTETELIALMDRNGIGTDATIAEHIEKILAREYITKSKQGSGKSAQTVLQPTVLGYGLADGFSRLGLEDISLTKPFMRKDMEENLKEICEGRRSKREVVGETLRIYKDVFHVTNSKMGVLIKAYEDALRHTQQT